MAYTPELSEEQSCTLRRIAWALNMPMTKAMDEVFNHLIKILAADRVCSKCRDKTRCILCLFNGKGGEAMIRGNVIT